MMKTIKGLRPIMQKMMTKNQLIQFKMNFNNSRRKYKRRNLEHWSIIVIESLNKTTKLQNRKDGSMECQVFFSKTSKSMGLIKRLYLRAGNLIFRAR